MRLMARDQHYEALMMEAREVLKVVGRETRAVKAGVGEREQEVEEEEECLRESKRRRFGRFIGMTECESPGEEDEGLMRAAMEAWVEREMGRRISEQSEREVRRGKGAW